MNEEWRQKISDSKKGQRISAETKEKISQSLKGRKLSEEHRQKNNERPRNSKGQFLKGKGD